jgi:phosphoribosylformylglycinamidine synthase subunit PurL
VALAEMAIGGGVGARVVVPGDGLEAVFGEAPGGVVVTVAPDVVEELAAICGEIPLARLGETGGETLVLEGPIATLTVSVSTAAAAHEEALPSSFA